MGVFKGQSGVVSGPFSLFSHLLFLPPRLLLLLLLLLSMPAPKIAFTRYKNVRDAICILVVPGVSLIFPRTMDPSNGKNFTLRPLSFFLFRAPVIIQMTGNPKGKTSAMVYSHSVPFFHCVAVL